MNETRARFYASREGMEKKLLMIKGGRGLIHQKLRRRDQNRGKWNDPQVEDARLLQLRWEGRRQRWTQAEILIQGKKADVVIAAGLSSLREAGNCSASWPKIRKLKLKERWEEGGENIKNTHREQLESRC